jgi:hypothetical protein
MHQQRQRIVEDVMRRVSYREIEQKYGVGRMSVKRHVDEHIGKALRKLATNEVALVEAGAIAEPVLLEMRRLHARCLKILDRAEAAKDYAVALQSVRECRRNLELVAKLTGELNPLAAGEGSGSALNVTVVYADKAAVGLSVPALPEPEGPVN